MKKMTFYEAMKPGTRQDGDVFRPDDTRYLAAQYIGGRWATMNLPMTLTFKEEYLRLEGTIERQAIDVDEFFSIIRGETGKIEGLANQNTDLSNDLCDVVFNIRNALERVKK